MDDMRYRTAVDPVAQKMTWEQQARRRASAPPEPVLSPKTEKAIGVLSAIVVVPVMIFAVLFFLLFFVTGG